MKFWGLVIVILGLVLITPRAQAQIVTVPIPGSPLSLSVQANPQPLQEIKNNPAATAYNLGDDGWANVPLPFSFPFYGRTFDTSTFYSNGAVQFGRPVPVGAWPTWNNAFCCSGQPLTSNLNPGYNYSIMPLWTDTVGYSGGNHYTLGTADTMTYGWYGVGQFGNPNNRSSFELKIDSSGGIDMRWSGALITFNPVTIGTIGDASKGEFTQNYHGSGINMGAAQLTTGVVDQCAINPLSSPTCSGYAAAYQTQQCSINALYDPGCPGYQQAYFTQQCTVTALYDPGCPGYQTAYVTQQCTANPLWNSSCPGYQQAYFTQQCNLSALYSPNCPGYDVAYQAYLRNQACTANPQSSPSCPGYVTPVVASGATATTAATADPAPAATATTTATVPVSTPQITADPVVNQAVSTTSTSTAPTAPAAPVQLTTAPTQTNTATSPVTAAVASQTASTSSGSSSSSSSSSANTATTPSSGATTTAQPTTRQAIAQARMDAARKEAAQRGTEAVKESAQAPTMAAQIATQGVVVAAIGFNPAFDAYNTVTLPDATFYRPYTIYGGQRTVDNVAVSRRLLGGSDQLHQRMVDQQFQLGK